jgi:hypothetical protein
MAPPMVDSPDTSSAKESFSQFFAKVLDQLSLSAWLPSAVLVASVFIQARLRFAQGVAAEAFGETLAISWSGLLLLLGAVVVLTVLVQAFEFEAIRLLEGYCGINRAVEAFTTWRCRHHMNTRRRLELRRTALLERSWLTAKRQLTSSTSGLTSRDVSLLELRALERPMSDSQSKRAADRGLDPEVWREAADPSLIRRADALAVRLREFPGVDHRVLPTRLGNVLRAHEDRSAELVPGDVEALVIRSFHKLPAAMQSEHDQYRTRLDLYCTLVFVAAASTVGGLALLWRLGLQTRLTLTAVGLLASWMFYRAAIATARGYGLMLVAIGEHVAAAGAVTPSDDPEP